MHVEPYDDDKMHIGDKMYGNNEVNYDIKDFINNFWYDENYELYDDDEAYYDYGAYDEDVINNNDKP
eukprot:15324155-Ditylum_brightwellii.AAC.1